MLIKHKRDFLVFKNKYISTWIESKSLKGQLKKIQERIKHRLKKIQLPSVNQINNISLEFIPKIHISIWIKSIDEMLEKIQNIFDKR